MDPTSGYFYQDTHDSRTALYFYSLFTSHAKSIRKLIFSEYRTTDNVALSYGQISPEKL